MQSDAQLQQRAETFWDVAVIGAGPAGCVAAAMLARQGRRVVLIEKSRWPREKVCGGCLNRSAIQTVREAGLGPAVAGGQGGRTLDRVEWRCGGRAISVPTPIGLAMLRSDLDAALASEAERLGCTFVPGVAASLLPGRGDEPSRAIQLRRGDRSATVTAGVVLVCDGIGGTSAAAEPWSRWTIARRGWIGVAATIGEMDAAAPAGAICMHVGAGGYVGMVRLADGMVHVAAALDPRECQRSGGPGRVVAAILTSTGIPLGPEMEAVRFRGTGVMTRRRVRLGGHRVLAVGDAGGYVEPFTGEGMAWAVRSAAAVSEFLPAAGGAWPVELPGIWESAHAAMIGSRQRWCRALRPIVHHPALASAVIGFGSLLPWAGANIASHVCGVEEQMA